MNADELEQRDRIHIADGYGGYCEDGDSCVKSWHWVDKKEFRGMVKENELET